MYDTGVTALVGPGHMYNAMTQRLKAVWEGLLSQATLIGGAEKRSSFSARRDAFTRKTGLMSETSEVPWNGARQVASSRGAMTRAHQPWQGG